jgi:hypothetical protein
VTALPTRPALALVVLAIAAAAAVGACGGGGADGEVAPTTTTAAGPEVTSGDASTTTQATVGGPFCTSVQAIRDLGGDAAAATPADVLAQNEQLLDLLDEASASVPDGAPADVEGLFDDYRTIAQAIGAAAGDVDAAYASIQASDPALAARLFNPTAHLPAFEFFEGACGVSLQ